MRSSNPHGLSGVSDVIAKDFYQIHLALQVPHQTIGSLERVSFSIAKEVNAQRLYRDVVSYIEDCSADDKRENE